MFVCILMCVFVCILYLAKILFVHSSMTKPIVKEKRKKAINKA